MFIQVIDCRLQDGKFDDFVALMEEWEREDAHLAPGYIGDDIIRDRNDPNHIVMIGKFTSAEKAAENSNRPEITANYHRMLALLESEPTFVDGDLILEVKAPTSD